MGKNDVLKGAAQCLTYGELIKEFRTSDILKNYRFKEEAMRRTTSVEFVTHTEAGREDRRFRDKFQTYLRSFNRILKNEFNEQQSSNWGPADTYDHTRRMPHVDNSVAGNGEMFPKEHSREEIDPINIEALTVLLATRWVETKITII